MAQSNISIISKIYPGLNLYVKKTHSGKYGMLLDFYQKNIIQMQEFGKFLRIE